VCKVYSETLIDYVSYVNPLWAMDNAATHSRALQSYNRIDKTSVFVVQLLMYSSGADFLLKLFLFHVSRGSSHQKCDYGIYDILGVFGLPDSHRKTFDPISIGDIRTTDYFTATYTCVLCVTDNLYLFVIN